MCGGQLDIADGKTTAVCDYCGTEQTVPTAAEEALQALFNRANVLRFKGEYDRAEEIYEKIIEKDASQAEAYYGVLLCRYGIEYVEDPKTLKRVPTCHRTMRESILDERYLRLALERADEVQKRIYQTEARAINEIQSRIRSIAASEKPYDIFISYKESDPSGKKTVDSSLADEIYYELNEEGYRVFFAPVTLKERLGDEYEPIIYSALSTSKIMIALGTRPEYFNAVWVKNEWSRFLKMMASDRDKKLIPCYRDMDAYELPEEFLHLQALNMSGIGFARELVKVIGRSIPSPKKKETVITQSAPRVAGSEVEALVKRAKIFLSDGEFARASEYCDKALDKLPECAEAYLYKALATRKLSGREAVPSSIALLKGDKDFTKARRFADKELRAYLEKCVADHEEELEYQRREQSYKDAVAKMDKAKTRAELEQASKLFSSLGDHRDALKLAEKCEERIRALLAEEARLAEEKRKAEEQARAEAEAKKKAEEESLIAGQKLRENIPGSYFEMQNKLGRVCGGRLPAFSGVVSVRNDKSYMVKRSVGAISGINISASMSGEKISFSGTYQEERYAKAYDNWWFEDRTVSDSIPRGICMSAGKTIVVGVSSDGTVKAFPKQSNTASQMEKYVNNALFAVANDDDDVLILKADGSAEMWNILGSFDEFEGKGLVGIAALGKVFYGITANGTVYASRTDKDLLKLDGKDVNKLIKETEEKEALAATKERWKRSGLCWYCGGSFKGLLNKTCTSCGKPKSYK